MIIKITPETDAERKKIQEVEHTGVREFFIFGNKLDDDNELVDFHDWKGSYRYIEGSCYHFLGRIRHDQDSKSIQEAKINVTAATPATPLIKRSGAEDGKIEGTVEVRKPNLRIAPNQKPNAPVVENAVMEDTAEEDATAPNNTVVEDNQETTD